MKKILMMLAVIVVASWCSVTSAQAQDVVKTSQQEIVDKATLQAQKEAKKQAKALEKQQKAQKKAAADKAVAKAAKAQAKAEKLAKKAK